MKTTLQKNVLTLIALFLSTLTYSQVITITDINSTFAEVQLGATVDYTIKYKNTGAADVAGTTQMYLFGAGTGGPNVSNNIALTYEPTTGVQEKTLSFSLTFINTPTVTKNGVTTDIENSADLAANITNGRYEVRFFTGGGSFSWELPKTQHFIGAPAGEIGNNNATGYLGRRLNIQSINYTVLSNSSFELNSATIYVSDNILNVSEVSKYEIYSITGALVSSGEASAINISKLSSGVYIYKSEKGTAKFVK